MPRPSLLPALLLPSLLVTACADDAATDLFPGRVPCGSTQQWNGDPAFHVTYVYDDDKHLLSSQTFSDDGAVTATATQTWVGGRLATRESQTAQQHTRTTYTWDGDRLATLDRVDLMLDDGDDGFTITNRYRDGVQYEQRFTWHDPAFGARLTTITGDDSTRSTWRDCPDPDDGSGCDVTVWEQPDRDPAHWTVGRFDGGSDGTIDEDFTQTYDAHFLPLVFEWARYGTGARVVDQRETHVREADGTVTRRTLELVATARTLTETFAFTCPAARASGEVSHRAAGPMPDLPLAVERRAPRDLR